MAQTLIDASTTISQVENTYWDLVAGVAQRRDSRGSAARSDRAAAEQRSSRAAAAPRRRSTPSNRRRKWRTSKPTCIRRCKTVSQLQNQLKSLVASNAGDPFGTRTSCHRLRCEQLPTASDLSTVVAEAQANRPEVRQALDKTARGRHRRRFCQESVAAAIRRSSAVSEQRICRHPCAGS